MILTIRTDKPEAELGLYDSEGKQLSYIAWQAHRELSSTILKKLVDCLSQINSDVNSVEAIVFYEGPGSFTGLRIGASLANAMEVPVVNATGVNWIDSGIEKLKAGTHGPAVPKYGAGAHITKPKK